MPRFKLFTLLLVMVTAVHLAVVYQIGSTIFSSVRNSAVWQRNLNRTASTQTTAFKDESIHLLFTGSDSYSIGLLALLNSTLVNASPISLPRLKFHVISANEKEAQEMLNLLRTRFGSALDDKLFGYGLEELGDDRSHGVKVWAGYRAQSLSKPIVFARYLVQEILPPTIERVIYLDQDLLVLKDLAPLWEVDLEGYPIAGARLCRSSALWRKQFVMNKQPLIEGEFDHDTCTLNNGVLVYDLKAWRNSSPSFTDQLFRWTEKNSRDRLYSLGSQPPFNLVFYRNYKLLDEGWNLMDIAGLREQTEFGQGLPTTRSREDVDSAAILHWNGVFKPWMCDGQAYYAEIWRQYFPDFRSFVTQQDFMEICSNLILTEPGAAPSVEKFTVVIVSFARTDTVLKIVKHLQHSDYVKEIIIAWNNLDLACPAALTALPWVRCLQQNENLVHNRFAIWPHVTTEAVLHYDDDLLAPLEDLEAGFNIWRHSRDRMLGFEPRVIVCEGDEARLHLAEKGVVPSSEAGLKIVDEPEIIPQNCQYRFKLKHACFDIVIGKLFFVSRNLMRQYFEHDDVVGLSTEAPCEDIAMNFIAANFPAEPNSNLPALVPRAPLLFKSNLTELHSKVYEGLSQGGSSTIWRGKRGECVQRLMEIFNGQRPAPQKNFFERDAVRQRVYNLPIQGKLDEGWCSDIHGSRICRQP